MTTSQPKMTKREMIEVARAARRHGYYARGNAGLEGYVLCPQCRQEITGYREINLDTIRRITMTAALDKAMLEHLPYCGEE